MRLATSTEVFVVCAVTGCGDTVSKSDKVPVTPARIAASCVEATKVVRLAPFAAASIAKTDPMCTGLVAARLALAGFVVGSNHPYTPALLLQGPCFDIHGEVLVAFPRGFAPASAGDASPREDHLGR